MRNIVLESIIQKYNIDFCAVRENNLSHIIFMLPYIPYSHFPQNCVQIDAFYEASNLLYHKVKAIREDLENAGYEIVDSHIQLKPMAEKGGLGTIVDNQLLANYKYGTKVTLQSITVVGDYECIRDMRVDKVCDKCGRCTSACPNGALSHGKFSRSKCLRHIQDYPEIMAENMGSRVIGCDECQRCCPYNAKVGVRELDESMIKLLDVDNMLRLIAKGKKEMAPLRELYGANYARPSYLARLIINTLIVNEDFSHIDQVSEFINHQDSNVRDLARLYLTKSANVSQD